MPLAWGGGIFGGGGGGAGSSGTGAAGRVSVWTGPGTIGGYAGFTFDSATSKATLSGGLIDSALTPGRVVIVGTAGELEDDPGFLFAKLTDTLTLTSGKVEAGLIKATSLATPGSITVTPKLTQTGAITTVAVGTRPTGSITCIRVATRATGLITCVAKANLIDGETVTIDDGTGAEVFEFDLVPDGVGGGNVVVDVSTATTAEDVAALLSAAIVVTFGPGTAINNLDGTITYQSNVFGVAGNIASSDTVADAGFSITGLSGAVAGIMDGETVTIDDGVSAATVFEFDISGGGVTPGNTAVVLAEGDFGAAVATALDAAIDGIGAGLLVGSTVNGGVPEQLDLVGDAYNATGNVAITDTVAAAGFTVAGMSGGVDGILDGETVTLDDGTTTYTFEFDIGGVVTPGNTIVPVAEGQSADTVKTNLIPIINGTAILMTASDGGVATIALAQDTPGNLGGANSETVALAGFAVTGMTSPVAATTVTYKLVAHLADGTATEAGAASSTAASTATLSAANLLRLTWSAVPGAASYTVYRTVAPTSPATTGRIVTTTTALTIDDTGLAGDGVTAPTVDYTGGLVSTALTSGRIPLVSTGGAIVDDSGLTYSGTGAAFALRVGPPTAGSASLKLGAATSIYSALFGASEATHFDGTGRWAWPNIMVLNTQGAPGLQLTNGYPLLWGAYGGPPDTSLSRIAPGVVGVGTGAAGSVAGTVSAAQLTLGADAFATRRAAATLQHGAADSATPVAQTIAFQGSRGATDTNVAGQDATVQGSLGTGTAASGKIVFSVGTPQATGTTQHVAAPVLTLQDTGTGGVAAPKGIFAGPVIAQVQVTANTGTATPAATDSRTVYTNTGDGDGSTVTLPAAAAGLVYTIYVDAAQTVTVTAVGDDTIRIAGNVTAAAGSITSNVTGSSVTLTAISATQWVATSSLGTWTF